MATPEPQAGILPEPTSSALFLVLRVVAPAEDAAGVARVLAGVPALAAKLAAPAPAARLVVPMAVGAVCWDVLSPERRPAGLRRLRALEVDGRRAPNTGGDVLLHVVSKRPDLNFELARQLRVALGDGTENPKGRERAAVALVGAEDPGFAGGSYVFTQRYVHDLVRWSELPVREQEGVVGRRKVDSRELSDAAKLATAHIARTVIEEHGKELEIVRHSFPYGTTSEHGLFFIAY
jgi:putative iron-dependent peroxidase